MLVVMLFLHLGDEGKLLCFGWGHYQVGLVPLVSGLRARGRMHMGGQASRKISCLGVAAQPDFTLCW